MKNDPKEMCNVFDSEEYASTRESLLDLLRDVQKQYGDDDPDETVKVLFHGDRRYVERSK